MVPICVDRSDRPSRPATDVLHTGDERRGYRTQPHTQHPELPLSRRDLPGVLFRHCYGPFARGSNDGVLHLGVLYLRRMPDLVRPERAIHAAGVPVDVHEPLHHRDHRGDGQERDDRLQQERVGPAPNDHRGQAQTQNPLGPLGDADLAIETQAFGPGAGVGDQK